MALRVMNKPYTPCVAPALLPVLASSRGTPWDRQECLSHINKIFQRYPMNFDLTFHTAELVTIMTAAAYVIRAANRVFTVLKDFPPHRHINGSIVYPEGYEPTVVQHLFPDKRNGAGAPN